MPTVSYNGQSFIVDGRRIWILGAAIQYARVPAALWADRIAAARQAGFNTILTSCPWFVHEPRKGQFVFQDEADVKRFVELCAAAKMRVILRPGPYVGSGFDGGGLPAWLTEDRQLTLREGNERFLERVSRYFRKLFGEVAELQITRGGPILLVQVEHDWTCANDVQARKYLREMARIVRESGISVPLINTNNLWPDAVDTIDTWRGDEDLLVNLRQLRTVQNDAPRLVDAFERPMAHAWAQPAAPGLSGRDMLWRLAEILAAGAQPIVSPFHGGTNFGFLGGNLPGRAGGPVTTSAAASPPLGEAGERGETYHQIRRIVSFAHHFGHVFADLDPDYQPVALDPREVDAAAAGAETAGRTSAARRGSGLSIVPLRGTGGRVIFVFGDGGQRSATLLLDSGIRLPINLGDQPVSWYVLEADLHGQGRLDFANLCPVAIVDRSIVVLHGPARTEAILSVNGTPMRATVPGGAKPLLIEHKGITFVICNRKQVDVTFHDEKNVYIGISGFDADGRPLPAAGWPKAFSVDKTGKLNAVAFDEDVIKGLSRTGKGRRSARTIRMDGWRAAAAEAYASGTSPRFASLSGPETLPGCGAPSGYGWYRLQLKSDSTRTRLVHMPEAGDRVHLYWDGSLQHVFGDGPGADADAFPVKLPKGEVTITALVDNFGRFAGGNDLDRRVGLFGHLYEVKAIKTAKPKKVEAEPADPFAVRGLILGASAGHGSDASQLQWTFTHHKKCPIIVDVSGATSTGAFVLNDAPIAYYAGETGACRACLMLDPASAAFKRGRNVLRFAPDIGQRNPLKDIEKATTLYECLDSLTAKATWAFAKWEPPAVTAFRATGQTQASSFKGAPCWWKCTFQTPDLTDPLWFDTTGLSKGQLIINDHNLGRYFTSTATGRAVGPQQRLYVPEPWLKEEGPNELLIFDEHGFSPYKTKLVMSPTGDLD